MYCLRRKKQFRWNKICYCFRFNTNINNAGQVLVARAVRGGKDLQTGFYPYHTTTVGHGDEDVKPELSRSRDTSKEDLSPST